MKTALVFGGAFNPPTLAHVNLAEYAMKETGSDCVIFVPTKNTYIEVTQQKSFAFSNAMRLEMLKKLQETRPWMLVSDYEILSPKQPRTYETLCHLREEGYACKLLFGSDKLGELETVWKYVHEIATEFGMVCLSRSEDHPAEMIENDPYLRTLKPYIQVIEAPEATKHMSSTQVRNELTEIMNRLARIRTIVPGELTGLILNYLTMEDNQ